MSLTPPENNSVNWPVGAPLTKDRLTGASLRFAITKIVFESLTLVKANTEVV